MVLSSCWLKDDEMMESMGMLPATSSLRVDSSRLRVVPSSLSGGVEDEAVVGVGAGVRVAGQGEGLWADTGDLLVSRCTSPRPLDPRCSPSISTFSSVNSFPLPSVG